MATLKYVEQISALYEEFFAYNERLQPKFYKSAKESGAYPTYIINDLKSDLILAIDEHDILIGFIHITEDITEPYNPIVQYKVGIIVDFIVTDTYRGQGIGKMLMTACKDWFRKRDIDYIELKAIANNPDAIRFYEREGFTTEMYIMRNDIKDLR